LARIGRYVGNEHHRPVEFIDGIGRKTCLLRARRLARGMHQSGFSAVMAITESRIHFVRQFALRARRAIDEQHSRFGAFLYRVTDMNTQESEIRLLTEQELGVVTGAMGVDVPVQILGRPLHISASTDFGISGAY
jgi:hypothetical protein